MSDFPPEVVKIMGDSLVERGTFTREQIDEMARGEEPKKPAAGGTAATKDPQALVDEFLVEQAQGGRPPINEAEAFAPAQPSEYHLPPLEVGQEVTPEYVEADTLYRSTLSKAGFPAIEGTRLMEEAVRTDQLLRDSRTGERLHEDDPRRVSYWHQQRELLEKVWKGDTTKNIAAALKFVDEIDPDHMTVFNRLWDSGALLNAWVLKGLYEQAARRARR